MRRARRSGVPSLADRRAAAGSTEGEDRGSRGVRAQALTEIGRARSAGSNARRMQVPDEPTVAVSPDEAVPPLDARRAGLHHERREPDSDSFSAPPGLEGPCRADDRKLVAERKAWVKRWSSAGNDLARAGKAGRSGRGPLRRCSLRVPQSLQRGPGGLVGVRAGRHTVDQMCSQGTVQRPLETTQNGSILGKATHAKDRHPEQTYISIRFAIQGTGKRGSARWKRWFYLLRAGRW